jgi:hypothetical protein
MRLMMRSLAFTAFFFLLSAGLLPAQNIVPNPEFAGASGIMGGNVTLISGFVPDSWRVFAVTGGAAEMEVIPVAADEVFAGSAETNSVLFRVTTFAGDQGFDDDNGRFPIAPATQYQGTVYVRSANADGSDQLFNMGFPLFDGGHNFIGQEPGGFGNATATADWQAFTGPQFLAPKGVAEGHISWRCVADDGEDAIQIAFPSVTGNAITEFPVNFACRRDHGDVVLDWQNAAVYEALRILRDSEELVVLDPAATTYTDVDVPDGVHSYQVLATLIGVEDGPTCEVAVFRVDIGTSVSVDLNDIDIEDGLVNSVRADGGDGENGFVITGPDGDPREARSNYGAEDPTLEFPDGIFYFTVTEPAMKSQSGFRIEATVYDDPARVGAGLWLQYTNGDSTGPGDIANTFYPQAAPPTRTLAGTDAWVVLSWDIAGAGFRSFQQGQADFRLGVTDGGRLAIDRVDVSYFPQPENLTCVRAESGVGLLWENAEAYESIEIERSGAVIARLPGDAVRFLDRGAVEGQNDYKVVAIAAGLRGGPTCSVWITLVPAGSRVSIDLGALDSEDGLAGSVRDAGSDGEVEAVNCGPAEDTRDARSNYGFDNPTPDPFFYFTVTDPAVKAQPGFRIEATVYDDPARAGAGLTLQYTNAVATGPGDLPDTFYPHPLTNNLGGTDAWVVLSWDIAGAGFRSFQQGQADFRLGVTDGGRLCIDKVDVYVGGCPTEGGTSCTGLTVDPPAGAAGLYKATATSSDVLGAAVSFIFVAENGIDPPYVLGPQAESEATFALADGDWTISVLILDDVLCPNPSTEAECSTTVKVGGGGEPKFRRGDTDGSGKLDLTDAIATLQFLYMGYTAPECKDAADTDDSGTLDLTDAIASLQFQFMGGTAPASPGPVNCGVDPTPEDQYKDCTYTTCGG